MTTFHSANRRPTRPQPSLLRMGAVAVGVVACTILSATALASPVGNAADHALAAFTDDGGTTRFIASSPIDESAFRKDAGAVRGKKGKGKGK